MRDKGSACTAILVVLLMSSCSSSEAPSDPQRAIASYGTWKSPLTAARVTSGALRFDHIVLDGDGVYWIEGRASEGGRNVVVRLAPDGRIEDVTPPTMNVRSRVHEYGGAAYTVHRGTLYFSNFTDQRLYRLERGGAPHPLTAEGYFFSDCAVDERRGRLVCVREDHTRSGAEPVNTIAAVEIGGTFGASKDPPLGSGVGAGLQTRPNQTVLVSGADFYSDPIVSPDGTKLAWLQWNHPNMPWDGTQLWVATLERDGTLGAHEKVAGGKDESIFQPSWSPDGLLYYVSDITGWWNLYRRRGADIEPIHPKPAEFGKAQWTFSMVTYAFISAQRLAVTYTEGGRWKMALIETDPRKFEPIPLALEPLESIRADARAVYFIGGSPTEAPVVARMTLAAVEAEVLRRSSPDRIDPAWISVPEAITYGTGSRFPGTIDVGNRDPVSLDVHAFFYAPRNPEFAAPAGEKPPLLVLTHGGPTGATDVVLDPEVQFWTSRGFAVLDVNYRGSTGYGRTYRDSLKGQWGVADVEDAVNGARHLVAQGKVDPKRLAIRGGSAGGYTTLAALTFHDVFQAGASYYGISDVEVLARDTHKFESRYLDSLIGPYPASRDVYRARSPIHFVDRMSAALILFQGLEDKVVPPNQSEMMAETLRRKGLPVAYVAYAGEQHGFRKAETIVSSLEAELYFYGAIFRFTPADRIEPVPIDNLR
jgi:dipeptidyl aminopeptidase/acylaminoacyl peptidase